MSVSSNREVQVTLEGKEVQEDWTFSRADTSYLTHGLHVYPARMIPQIARQLILTYTDRDHDILDPFCGSGTTLVEARLNCRNAVGNDVNPLALLFARVKSNPLDFESLGFDFSEFVANIETEHSVAKKRHELPKPPQIVPNLLHWFKESAARDLEFLYQRINEVQTPEVRDFLSVVFSKTVLRSSNIDHRSSRFVRILHEKELARFTPNVMNEFRKALSDALGRMSMFLSRVRESPDSCALSTRLETNMGDACELPFSEKKFHAVITSPPYGEEKNTVDYTRWSRLSVAWLRLNEEAEKGTELKSLGAVVGNGTLDLVDSLPSVTAKKVLSKVARLDRNRARDAIPFFFDYMKSLSEMKRVLKPDSCCCIVIGNRSIRRIPLDMEKVTVELAENVGFKHIRSIFRDIPMKLIPWTTPTGKTISRENIVILRS